jgi:excisionase family DNA binding protein
VEHLLNPPEPNDELLSLYQVAELLYAHPETVNKWLLRGQLRGFRVNGGKRAWRIWASDFHRFQRILEEQGPSSRDTTSKPGV